MNGKQSKRIRAVARSMATNFEPLPGRYIRQPDGRYKINSEKQVYPEGHYRRVLKNLKRAEMQP